jgi:hypothetical protein
MTAPKMTCLHCVVREAIDLARKQDGYNNGKILDDLVTALAEFIVRSTGAGEDGLQRNLVIEAVKRLDQHVKWWAEEYAKAPST